MSSNAEELRPSRLRLLTCLALWLVVSIGVLLAPGCYGQNCEGGAETFGSEITDGHMVTPDVWESSSQGSKWLWFPRQHVYFFDIPALGGRVPYQTTAYLSAEEEPNKSGHYTQAAGSVAVFSGVGPNRVDVRNDTCSDYYLRVVLEVPPFAPVIYDAGAGTSTPSVAGSTADGGSAEAEEADER